MKSTTILKPLEYTITALGEKWHQGDTIHGTLNITNHSSEPMELPMLKITLMMGSYKKIKAKHEGAFSLLQEISLAETLRIEPLATKELSFSFKLLEDSMVTDKNSSLYLAFSGNINNLYAGYLELLILPKIVMLQFIEILVNFLRFKIVQTRFHNGMVEIKLNPPSSREFSHIETLVIRMKEIQSTLELEYIFNLQVLESVAGNFQATKKTKSVEQKLLSKDYLIYGQSPNHEFIKNNISQIIKESAPKIFT